MNDYQYRPSGFRVLTPVIKNLLIINVLFFLAKSVMRNAYGLELNDILGLHFPLGETFKPWQIVTYMFSHGDFTHIFFNMFALWMFGKPIEERFGAKRFLIYYFVTGIGAAVAHYTVMYFVDMKPIIDPINEFLKYQTPEALETFMSTYPAVLAKHQAGLVDNFELFFKGLNASVAENGYSQDVILNAVSQLQEFKTSFYSGPNVVGASGSVFGILLAFGMLFPNSVIYLYFAIPIRAKWFVIIFGVLELYLGVRGSGGNIAHLAHVGGMVFGYLLILLWNRKANRPTYY